MIPEIQEPIFQLMHTIAQGTGHEHTGAKVDHIGMELVDKCVEMIQ